MSQKSCRILISLLMLSTLLINLVKPGLNVLAQTNSPENQAEAILSRLTVEERVGQLFLVTFQGNQITPDSRIYDLVVNHHIGGVVLSAENDNFTDSIDILSSTYQLISGLQSLNSINETTTSAVNTTTLPAPVANPDYIPLFIGISQEGDQYPFDQILSGLTELPDQMAIGATWNTQLAEQAGEVMGRELTALGFNLLLGPSLDVLDVVSNEGGEDLGTRTFGGDPFWVAAMGQAMISGLHQGSDGGLIVIAKHFPGRGGSDRPPEEEVATVRSSLEQLKQIELAPFFAVTGNAPDQASTVDGLLLSHIRYQGFQGNIRATTRPVSFDSAALDLIMSLTEFSTWRQNGGIIVSDDLGSNAVRRFFDPAGTSFDARQVARNAFLAGNDLLYMDQIISTNDPDAYTTIIHILEFFVQRYQADPDFADRVDSAVLRLLTLKYRIYHSFSPSNIIPAESGLEDIGQNTTLPFEIARQAATLISPSALELSGVLPDPPGIQDRIIFFTDTQNYRQCSTCSQTQSMAINALQSAVLQLYGRQSGGVIFESHLSSYSFTDLEAWLNDPGSQQALSDDLARADWVVFSTLNIDPARPESQALLHFLNQRSDLSRSKRVIVFAFNAPYFLDATDISKVTACYGLYSKGSAFIDIAARILFQELTPTGALPVSVTGVGYDLITAMSPDPNQVIQLMLDFPQTETTPTTSTPESTQIASYAIGDTLPMRTGVIVDHNGHVVPDGTVVRFMVTVGGDTGASQQFETTTFQGVARMSYRIASPGLHDIRVTADPAMNSNILQIEVLPGAAGFVIAITPTSGETQTPEPISTSAPMDETGESLAGTELGVNFLEWVITMFLAGGGAFGVFTYGKSRVSLRWGIRWGFCTFLGSLFAYIIAQAVQVPNNFPVLFAFIGAWLGWGGGWCWQHFPEIQKWIHSLQK